MSETISLTPIDWGRYEHFLAALRSGHEALLQTLAKGPYRTDPTARERLHLYKTIPEFPRSDLALLGVTVQPHEWAEELAAILLDDEEELAQLKLVELAQADAPHTPTAPQWLLLAWLSEAYRIVAVSADPDYGPDEPVYDGEPAALEALGGLVPVGSGILQVHTPSAVRALAERLAAIDLESHPIGDVGPLLDLHEDLFGSGRGLSEWCREELTVVRQTYEAFADEGYGVRVAS